MGAKKKRSAGASKEGVWKRVAAVSILLNIALLIYFLGGRFGASDEQASVSQFIDTYFLTWSNQDMTGYRNCFHPAAVIHFLDSNGVPVGAGLDPFIESQRQVHARSEVPMREIPLEKSIEIDGNVARALVRWKLFKNDGEELGTDYFSLVKTKTGWRIVGLIFRKDT